MNTHVSIFPRCRLGLLLLALVSSSVGAATEVSNFALLDQRGRLFELRRANAQAVVLFFTANGCPVARQYAAQLRDLRDAWAGKGVEILLVNSNTGDDRASILKEMRELKASALPVLKDDTQGVARHLKVARTGEVIAINARDWTVFYRGAVDDRAAEGAQKPEASARYLETALTEFLGGRPVSQPKTVARGCVISYDGGEGPDAAAVSYVKDVAPILMKNCVSCHSAGNIGSWSMSGHRRVKGMAAMIEEVLLARRMPPWDADPAVGKFANAPALSVDETKTLLRWVHQGAPRGEGTDPLEGLKVPKEPEWPLGPPDLVLRLPKAEQIPATGVVEYRHIEVPAGNASPAWVRAAWVKPGNLKVLHHLIVRLKGEDDRADVPGFRMFVGWAPGATRGEFPAGSGKFLPANAKFDFELHYTTNGVAQTDQTEVGLYFHREAPARVFEAVAVINSTFEIRPHEASAQTQQRYFFKRGATLHSVTPHMHVRGRSMKFELMFPDGKTTTVASLPRYDFNWQLTYQLKQPIKVPPGTWAVLSGTFDNSKANPANPDPSRPVRWGEQSWEEMFLGWYNVTWDAAPAAGKSVAGRSD